MSSEIDPFFGIPEARARMAQRAQCALISAGMHTYARPFTGAPVHGPTARPDGRDCGCGWGDLCTARDGMPGGVPFVLCGAEPKRWVYSAPAPAWIPAPEDLARVLDGLSADDARAILSGASRYYRHLAASYPRKGAHATRDNALRLARAAEQLHARVKS